MDQYSFKFFGGVGLEWYSFNQRKKQYDISNRTRINARTFFYSFLSIMRVSKHTSTDLIKWGNVLKQCHGIVTNYGDIWNLAIIYCLSIMNNPSRKGNWYFIEQSTYTEMDQYFLKPCAQMGQKSLTNIMPFGGGHCTIKGLCGCCHARMEGYGSRI